MKQKNSRPKAHKPRPFPRNRPCPCGSGKLYRDCCISKAFKFGLNKKNEVVRSVPIHPKLDILLRKLLKEFKNDFGRSPGKRDLVMYDAFFRSPPEEMREKMKQAALDAGVAPPVVYATWKTGLIVSEG